MNYEVKKCLCCFGAFVCKFDILVGIISVLM